MGKGDSQRPLSVTGEVYETNWERTFKKQKQLFRKIAQAVGDMAEGKEPEPTEEEK